MRGSRDICYRYYTRFSHRARDDVLPGAVALYHEFTKDSSRINTTDQPLQISAIKVVLDTQRLGKSLKNEPLSTYPDTQRSILHCVSGKLSEESTRTAIFLLSKKA